MRSSDRGGPPRRLRGPRAGPPPPSPRPRRSGDGGVLRRGRFRPFEFDDSVRLRPDGALRRPPPEDLHHAVGTADPAPTYYHCAACRRGSYPRDQALGLQDTSLSPATARLVGLAATSQLRRSERVDGGAARRGGRPQTGRAPSPKRWAAKSRPTNDERVEPAPGAASTMYLGLDGTGVPVRKSEVEGRRGKQPDGSAKYPRGQARPGCGRRPRNADGLPERGDRVGQLHAAVESAASRPTDPRLPRSRNGRIAKRGGAASTRPIGATSVIIGEHEGPSGSGILGTARTAPRRPSKSSTSTMPRGICAMSAPRPSTAPVNGLGRPVGQGPAGRVGRRAVRRRS